MTHLIVSAVIFVAALVSIPLYTRYIRAWQDANKSEIAEFKAQFGKDMTLYPNGHSIIVRLIGLGLSAGFIYLVIALLLFFFA